VDLLISALRELAQRGELQLASAAKAAEVQA
jgi:hypothetical protein